MRFDIKVFIDLQIPKHMDFEDDCLGAEGGVWVSAQLYTDFINRLSPQEQRLLCNWFKKLEEKPSDLTDLLRVEPRPEGVTIVQKVLGEADRRVYVNAITYPQFKGMLEGVVYGFPSTG